MDFFQTKDFFQKLYPGKEISFEFDEICHRRHELVYTDGLPNELHHIENNKVKVSVEGQDPVYVDILPHREVATWDYMNSLISNADVKIKQKRVAEQVEANLANATHREDVE